MTLEIATLPKAIPTLSDAEAYALQEVIPLAEDLSLRGDERATVVLEWARDLLKIETKP